MCPWSDYEIDQPVSVVPAAGGEDVDVRPTDVLEALSAGQRAELARLIAVNVGVQPSRLRDTIDALCGPLDDPRCATQTN